MTDNAFSQGDMCFLFTQFPLDHHSIDISKPFEIHDGIYLVRTPPFDIPPDLSNKAKARNIALTEWINPGFHLGLGMCHTSIKVNSVVPYKMRGKYFWTFITALLLVKPLFIHIAGTFIYGDAETDFINTPGKLDLRSNLFFDLSQYKIQPQSWLSYNAQDIKMAKNLFPIILHYWNPNNNLRLSYIIQQFQQALIFEKLHYASSIYSKLFPLVDSLAGNPKGLHHEYVSKRLGKFSTGVLSNETNKGITEEEITKRLKYIWELHRYPELHGHIKESIYPNPDIPNSSPNLFPNDENIKDLRDLAEIARVCLLKIFLLNEHDRNEYCKILIPETGKSQKEAKKNNEDRTGQADAFFGKSYSNSNELIFYSNLTALKK